MTVAQSAGYSEIANGSWYSVKTNHGTATASGEIFDNNKITVAHKTLPLGTLVRVTNLQNGRAVVARVNDRGPYVPNRVVDLSPAAFAQIGNLQSGVIPVKVETVRTVN